MEWRITVVDRQQRIRLRQGEAVDLSHLDIALSSAIAPPGLPGELAVVLAAPSQVLVDGRRALCPIVAVDRRGLNLTIDCRGAPLRLRVEPAGEPPGRRDGRCPLCRMAMADGEIGRECPSCGTRYHAECLGGEQKCPACGRAPSRW